MQLPAAEQSMLHAMSQLVYLDVVPAMAQNGVTTIGSLADYILTNPVGKTWMKVRFGSIPREYEAWLYFLEHTIQPWRDWYIQDVYDDNGPRRSGLYACTYRSPMGEKVVAFRGSENLGNPLYRNDYRNNLALAYAMPTPQQEAVEEYWRRFARSGPLYLTGHSLGGNLAAYAAASAPGYLRRDIIHCMTLNAPGMNHEFLARYENELAELESRLTLVQNQYDIVSSLLLNIREPWIAASTETPEEAGSIWYPHSNFFFLLEEDGSFVPADPPEKSNLCQRVHQFSILFLQLPLRARQDIGAIILQALYRPPSRQNTVRYILEAVSKYLMHHSDTLGEASQLPVLSLWYAAQALYAAGKLEEAARSNPLLALLGALVKTAI